MKIISCSQSKNEQEKDASNLIITRRWSSELHEDSAVLCVSRVAKAKCKQNSSLERNDASI
jgi:hypothetical protein